MLTVRQKKKKTIFCFVLNANVKQIVALKKRIMQPHNRRITNEQRKPTYKHTQ